MTAGEHKAALKEKLLKQRNALFTMRFHAEVAHSRAKVANARRPIRQHLRIALRSIEVDFKAVEKRLVKLGA